MKSSMTCIQSNGCTKINLILTKHGGGLYDDMSALNNLTIAIADGLYVIWAYVDKFFGLRRSIRSVSEQKLFTPTKFGLYRKKQCLSVHPSAQNLVLLITSLCFLRYRWYYTQLLPVTKTPNTLFPISSSQITQNSCTCTTVRTITSNGNLDDTSCDCIWPIGWVMTVTLCHI